MRKIFVKDDLRTMSVILLIASVISIVAIGVYSGVIMINALTDTAESRAISHLESADFIMIEKTKNIQRFADILNANDRLHTLITVGDKNGIHSIMRKTVADFEDIEGCILVDSQGRDYVYNLPFITEDNLLQLQVSCTRLSEKTGQLK